MINKQGSGSNGQQNVSPNLFGFVSVILRRRVNLTALSKEFLVAYELQQKDFDELVAQYPADFETVCELRDKILNLPTPESYEGPELLDPRFHFVPLRRFVINKCTKSYPQVRRLKPRRENPPPSDRFDHMQDDISEETDELLNSPHHEDVSEKVPELKILNMEKRDSGKRKSSLTLSHLFAKEQNQYTRNSIYESEKANQQPNFEQAKSYNKYFVRSNIERVIKRFNPVEKLITLKSATFRKGRSRRELPPSHLLEDM